MKKKKKCFDKVLITGINGFIGSYVAKLLKKEYPDICIIGIGRTNSTEIPDIEYNQMDISDDDFVVRMKNTGQKCSAIFHLAASVAKDNYDSLIKTNIDGTYNVCSLAREWNTDCFIYMSSIPVIGIPEIQPVLEDAKVNPQSFYHVTKLSAENIVKFMCKNMSINHIIRIPSPIGIGMNKNTFLPIILNKLINNEKVLVMGRGKRVQSYVDVRDIASAVILAAHKEGQSLLNISGQTSISNIDLVLMCKDIVKSESKIEFSGIDPEEENIWNVSYDLARIELGYEPNYSLENTVKWMIGEKNEVNNIF